ncbi:MAG: PKD domain-containing protein, partial [Thermoplasmata archaeon]|nr:PKD domain-containing protein [Thermoplasmata archaeon]
HYINITAMDDLGNVAYHNQTVYVDNSPPDISKEYGKPYYNDGTNEWITSLTPIYINATDAGLCPVGSVHVNVSVYSFKTGITTYYETSVTNETASLLIYLPEECKHYINITAMDDLGNVAYHNQTVYVDNSPPEIDYTINPSLPNGDNGWYVTNVVVTLSAIDNGSSIGEFMYRINNGAWKNYNNSFSLTEDGTYKIKFYARDNTGNNASNNITIKIDKTPPSSAHTLDGKYSEGKYTSDVTVRIHASDTSSGSGVKEIHYRLDGGGWQIFSGSLGSDVVSSEMTHTIEYYSVDYAGNTEAHHTATFTILKNKPPVADFSYSPSQPYDTQSITFADESNDSDGYITNWTWNFGDGNISYEQNPTHKYADNGTYVVKLIVKDDDGAINSKQEIINVLNAKPVATINYQPNKPKVNEEIAFKSIGSDADGSIVNWTWNFGDGSVGYGSNINHSYEKEGKYNVTLTVTDNDGATDSTVITVEVKKEIQNIWLPLTIIVILVIIAIALVAVWKKRTKS